MVPRERAKILVSYTYLCEKNFPETLRELKIHESCTPASIERLRFSLRQRKVRGFFMNTFFFYTGKTNTIENMKVPGSTFLNAALVI